MKFLFDDESFSFETLRAAGFANDGGSDLGEVLATARNIGEGDEDAWLREWKNTAQRVHAIGSRALAAGHRVSAREALLRASNYYRTAEFYRRDDPANDPEVKLLSTLSRETFAQAAALMDTPVEAVRIPYQDTSLPGYLFLVDDSGTPRPTVIFTSGFDSTLEEVYFVVAAAALRRGYNVLAYDGPGQGAALREQALVFRPDWEAVVTPVVDCALTRPEIAPDRIVLMGYSLGGYLTARAAAHEHRLAALVLDDGLYSYHDANTRIMPPFLREWVETGRDDLANPVAGLLMTSSTQVRWALRNGVWTFGATSVADYIRRTTDYTLDGVAHLIDCPTLILDAENDQFFHGQPQRVAAALTCPQTLITLPEAEGAGEHCHMGAMSRFQQATFDWLDTTLSTN
ncbi:2,6-dihydropseudooxynicotine hydrolase [Streptomyces sp. ADI95-16]|uniref:alpha/beta hydrolase family protein n=1 Tax=Streptomyces sp. ADI95-16 TaxID=1522758 RepID=UPI000F3A9274|nr:alpha/beta hydrolase [Streptomyces sp. ADI95-16]AYV31771.1 2,6-dihydropseudooxynicotine hydrolase [Streptomyces sp. ADI95-16]